VRTVPRLRLQVTIGTFQVAEARPQVMVRGFEEMKGRLQVMMKGLWWVTDRLQAMMGRVSSEPGPLSNIQIQSTSVQRTILSFPRFDTMADVQDGISSNH